MRKLISSYLPQPVLQLTDEVAKYLPHPLKLKYHNLGKEPAIDFILPTTFPNDGFNLRAASSEYAQSVDFMNHDKAVSRLVDHVSYHLKLNHKYIIMVSYLNNKDIDRLQDLAQVLKRSSLALSANEVPSIFSSKEVTKETFKNNDLIIITETDKYLSQSKVGFTHLNELLRHDVISGKRTIQLVLDNTVTSNEQMYFNYSMYHELMKNVSKVAIGQVNSKEMVEIAQ